MTRQEAIEKLGGRRNAIIGGAVGCGSIGLGLLLACGLMFGWVGNTVSAAYNADHSGDYTVADKWGAQGTDSKGEAAAQCGPTQKAIGTVYGDGSFAGWQCVDQEWYEAVPVGEVR